MNTRDLLRHRGRAVEIVIGQTVDQIDDVGIRVIFARLRDQLFACGRVIHTTDCFFDVSGIRLTGVAVILGMGGVL
ncbi:hypothetical protein HDG33_006682 [Paraburkholderia sp. Cpub6]|nr:hypothetical protein [Paraburkholderia sp. Cpub6]